MKLKLKDVLVRGRTFEIRVDDVGRFFSSLDGSDVYAPSLDLLVKKLNEATAPARKSLNVRFVAEDDGALRRCTITGVHASNNNWLGRWDGGKSEQLYTYKLHNEMTDLSDTELAEARSLWNAIRIAQRAFDDFRRAHKFDVRSAVSRALEAADAGQK